MLTFLAALAGSFAGAFLYHCYVEWRADRKLDRLAAERAKESAFAEWQFGGEKAEAQEGKRASPWLKAVDWLYGSPGGSE